MQIRILNRDLSIAHKLRKIPVQVNHSLITTCFNNRIEFMETIFSNKVPYRIVVNKKLTCGNKSAGDTRNKILRVVYGFGFVVLREMSR